MCEEIDCLVKTYTQIQYRAMKLAMTGNTGQVAGIEQLLDQQDARERRIKQSLQTLFDDWWLAQPADQTPEVCP